MIRPPQIRTRTKKENDKETKEKKKEKERGNALRVHQRKIESRCADRSEMVRADGRNLVNERTRAIH